MDQVDAADRTIRKAGALPEARHIMPWRIEDEGRKLDVNYVKAGAFRPFAIYDGNSSPAGRNCPAPRPPGESSRPPVAAAQHR